MGHFWHFFQHSYGMNLSLSSGSAMAGLLSDLLATLVAYLIL